MRALISKLARLYGGLCIRVRALRNRSWISLLATLDVEPGGEVVVGTGVRVIRGTMISVLRGAKLALGDGVWIGPYNIIYCAQQITIGQGTRISHFCSVIDHNYDYRATGGYFLAPKVTSPISIGDGVWLGAGCTVLKGAEVGERCVVGAGALIRAGKIGSGYVCYRPSDEKTVVAASGVSN